MTRRQATLAIALVAGAGGLWLRAYLSDEAVIRRMIKSAARAVEEKRLLGVATRISRRYSDPYGQSYESFLGALNDLFTTYPILRVPHRVRSVSVSGQTAVVELSFRLYGGEEPADLGCLIGTTTTPATATLLVRQEPGGWQIERVEDLDIPNAPPPTTVDP